MTCRIWYGGEQLALLGEIVIARISARRGRRGAEDGSSSTILLEPSGRPVEHLSK